MGIGVAGPLRHAIVAPLGDETARSGGSVERSGIERGPCGMRGDARHRFMRTSPAMATLQRAVVRAGFQSIPCWQKALCVKVRQARTCTIPDVGLPRWEPRRNRLAFHLRCIARIRLSGRRFGTVMALRSTVSPKRRLELLDVKQPRKRARQAQCAVCGRRMSGKWAKLDGVMTLMPRFHSRIGGRACPGTRQAAILLDHLCADEAGHFLTP